MTTTVEIVTIDEIEKLKITEETTLEENNTQKTIKEEKYYTKDDINENISLLQQNIQSNLDKNTSLQAQIDDWNDKLALFTS